MDILISVVTLVAGIFIGNRYAVVASSPRLRPDGAGGYPGGKPEYPAFYVEIKNLPGLVGLRLEPRILFGRRLHGRIRRGVPRERDTAKGCTATLKDKTTGKPIAPLWWRSPPSSESIWQLEIDIESGVGQELMMFARRAEERLAYCVFQPPASEVTTPMVSARNTFFEGPQEFVVDVRYSYGLQWHTFDVKISEHAGRLHFDCGRGGSGGF